MNRITIVLAILVSVSMGLMAQQHKGIDIRIDRLEKKNESVFLNYEIASNGQRFSACETVLLHPYFQQGDSVIQLEPIVFNGKLRKNSFKRQAALTGDDRLEENLPRHIYTVSRSERQAVPFQSEFRYAEWMNGGVLYATQTVWGCGADLSETTLELARLVVPEPIPEPEPEPEPTPEPEPEVKEVLHKEGTAYIDFPIGKSAILLDFGGNQKELSKIGELISDINKDPNAKITGLIITGYASPDGPYAINERLSRERAQALSQHINIHYRLNLSFSQIHIYNVAEDWEGLSQLITESYLPEREEIVNIINTVPSLDERKQRLMRLGGGSVYKMLKERFYPKLRRTEYKILYQTEE